MQGEAGGAGDAGSGGQQGQKVTIALSKIIQVFVRYHQLFLALIVCTSLSLSSFTKL